MNSYFDCKLICQKNLIETNSSSKNDTNTEPEIISTTTTEDNSQISNADDKICRCGHSNFGRIVNGQSAPGPGSFPWQIILKIRDRFVQTNM